MIHPPLKRHQALQPFSRDHYAGLVQAKRLRVAASQNPAQRAAALNDFLHEWREQLAEHLDDEERLLGALIVNSDDAERLRRDHATLRACAKQGHAMLELGHTPEPQWLETLSRTLAEHIRWEERSLFSAIEHSCEAAHLHNLAQITDGIEASRPRWDRAPEGRYHHRSYSTPDASAPATPDSGEDAT